MLREYNKESSHKLNEYFFHSIDWHNQSIAFSSAQIFSHCSFFVFAFLHEFTHWLCRLMFGRESSFLSFIGLLTDQHHHRGEREREKFKPARTWMRSISGRYVISIILWCFFFFFSSLSRFFSPRFLFASAKWIVNTIFEWSHNSPDCLKCECESNDDLPMPTFAFVNVFVV